MKILMLVDLYPPNIGGVEKHVQSLSATLHLRGHQIIVCTLGHPISIEFENGVKVYREEGFFQKIPFLYGKSKKRWHPPAADWLLTQKILNIIKREKPDIIHVHGWILYSLLPIKKKIGIPVIVTLHGYGYFCPITNLLRNNKLCSERSFWNCLRCAKTDYGFVRSLAAYCGIFYNQKKLEFVDKYIAVSNFVKEAYLNNLSLDDNDIVVIPNFYTSIVSDQVKTGIALPEDFILFVGALAPYKGLDVLLEAVNKLHISTKLVIIGYSYQNYQYKSSDNILIYENMPFNLVTEAYRKCRFAIFPSICPECFGTVVLEAMSCKKAVITSRIGGYTDIILNNETGLLVPANDADALSRSIKYLLDNPVLADNMGNRGYKHFIQNFTAEIVVARIEKLYYEVLNK